jgi:hypothetical protein
MTRDEASNPGRYLHILYAARFRRPEDRRRLRQLYRQFFEPLYPLGSQDGMLRQEEGTVGVGEFCVRLGTCQLEGRGERLALLERQRPLLESMAGCIHHSWPVILTGTYGSPLPPPTPNCKISWLWFFFGGGGIHRSSVVDPHQIKIWNRIRIILQKTRKNEWNMSLFSRV